MALVGFSDREFALNKPLGSQKRSYSYKADGKIFNQKAGGDEYGPKFEKGDVVGCGLIISRKQIFFTINGRYLGTAFSNVELLKDGIYPSICLQSLNEEVSSTFWGGVSQAEQALTFDIEGFRLDLAQAEFLDIKRMPFNRATMFEMIKSYLVHYAYVETLQALEEESNGEEALYHQEENKEEAKEVHI
mmetsp:Transcript_29595/g.28796  ORF Transcript_29595/g.28796 Transcript_29595/m.28796 type:complete len:189 (-) Transcript_29595:865-1431(-)